MNTEAPELTAVKQLEKMLLELNYLMFNRSPRRKIAAMMEVLHLINMRVCSMYCGENAASTEELAKLEAAGIPAFFLKEMHTIYTHLIMNAFDHDQPSYHRFLGDFYAVSIKAQAEREEEIKREAEKEKLDGNKLRAVL